MDNDDFFNKWSKFNFKIPFLNDMSFNKIRNDNLRKDLQQNVRKFTRWVSEFTMDFILPNIEDEGDKLILTINTPGIPKKNLKIRTNTRSITLYIKKEERDIKRKIKLPAKIIPSESYSQYKNGQLKIYLTKKNKDENISIE
ncbi:MAG: hypothetical protein GF329_02125 [Candidatus Lokiarchaeota archaeon]|nr:hypothetical protein [Candidatus Lokiarchaeota archaeon]